jgi:uncharacterized membrane protein
MSEETKPFWQSKTVIGAAVTILALAASFRQIEIDVVNTTEIVMDLIGIAGAVLAVYGRVKATKPITFVGTKPGGRFNPYAEIRKATRNDKR